MDTNQNILYIPKARNRKLRSSRTLEIIIRAADLLSEYASDLQCDVDVMAKQLEMFPLGASRSDFEKQRQYGEGDLYRVRKTIAELRGLIGVRS